MTGCCGCPLKYIEGNGKMMICGEKSAAIYKLYGITQFFEQPLQDNGFLDLLALVREESIMQRPTYSDSKFNKVYCL